MVISKDCNWNQMAEKTEVGELTFSFNMYHVLKRDPSNFS